MNRWRQATMDVVQIPYRLKKKNIYIIIIFAFVFVFAQLTLVSYYDSMQKKEHSITIVKMKVIHRGYTVVAVLRKEHGSKRWTVFISLKAKQTTQTKSEKTNKQTNYTSHKWIREATAQTGNFVSIFFLFLVCLFICCRSFFFFFSCSTLKIEAKLQTPVTHAEKTQDKQRRSCQVCIGTVGIVKANFTTEEPLYAQRFICDLRSADSFVSRVQTKYNRYRKEGKTNKHNNLLGPCLLDR